MMPMSPLEGWTAAKIGREQDFLNRETLEQYQRECLQETIRYAAANSLFYRNRLGKVAAGRIDSLADIAALPFTTEADLRNFGREMLCVSQSMISRVVTLTTSGTCGAPKRIWFTPEDQALTVDFFRAGMSTLVEPGDRVLILLPGERAGSVGELLAQALESAGITAILHGPVRSLAETLRVIRAMQVSSLVGIPVQILALARHSVYLGHPPVTLKSVLLSTDYAATSLIREVERIWQCKVFDHYGMTEMGLGGGVECAAHSGYHLREADLYFEIIDPDSGEVVPAGCEGEVVFSTLNRRGMPLIRYRTGDLSRFLPEKCCCGSVLKRLDRISGRLGVKTILPDGAKIRLNILDEAVFAIPGVIDFSAGVADSQVPMSMEISLLIVGAETAIESACRHQISRIAGIGELLRSGRLNLMIRTTVCEEILPAIPGKRTIEKAGQ
jgi:phenylacetate-coenzyme A ligase PaaK-like adenylate-forming protein